MPWELVEIPPRTLETMILRSLRAENFMRFERLELESLPARGLIGIEGPNESGKSSIAEVILFAFFGTARESRSCPIGDLMRWGAPVTRVEVVFAVDPEPDAEIFSISREIDRLGANWVRVVSISMSREIARGSVAVQRFVRDRIRFDGAEFQRSFFHGQSSLSLDRAELRAFLDVVIGISDLEDARKLLEREIGKFEREFTQFQRESERGRVQTDRFAVAAARVPELEATHATVTERLARVQLDLEARRTRLEKRRSIVRSLDTAEKKLSELAKKPLGELAREIRSVSDQLRAIGGNAADRKASLGDSAQIVEDGVREILDGLGTIDPFLCGLSKVDVAIRSATDGARQELDRAVEGSSAALRELASREIESDQRRARGRARLVFAQLLVAILVTAAAILLLRHPRASEWVSDPRALSNGLWAISAALSLGALIGHISRRRIARRAEELALRRTSLDRDIAATEARSQRLAELLDRRERNDLVEYLDGARATGVPGIVDAADPLVSGHSRLLRPGKGGKDGGIQKFFESLARRLRPCREKLDQETAEDTRALKELESESRKLQSDLERIHGELRDSRGQALKKSDLEAHGLAIDARAAELRSKIDDHNAALLLIRDTAMGIRWKTGPAIERIVREVLPCLTAERYRDVKLDDRLDVRVYSKERGDFVSPSELSGGANEALSFALRIAFSMALATNRGVRAQVAILDEPFARMDEKRVIDALRWLRMGTADPSNCISQCFVIQPSFIPEQRAEFDLVIEATPQASTLLAARSRGVDQSSPMSGYEFAANRGETPGSTAIPPVPDELIVIDEAPDGESAGGGISSDGVGCYVVGAPQRFEIPVPSGESTSERSASNGDPPPTFATRQIGALGASPAESPSPEPLVERSDRDPAAANDSRSGQEPPTTPEDV
jgi:DNA repair exonuclease SbcCD ATPase subunit